MSSLLFGNGTDLVHWKPSPKSRGTFDILSTCIITMLLCVSTAVHLNVPPPGSVWGPRLRKVGWLVLALLAPEMVAYTAGYQRQKALSTMRMVNEAFVLPDPPSWHERTIKGVKKAYTVFKRVFMPREQETVRQPTLEAQRYPLPEDRHPWTIVHGFYAVMGGIAFKIPDNLPESKRFLSSNTTETCFLSHDGINLLSEQEVGRDLLPNLSEEEIKSKSKANGVAKALVCIQALWFIAQCLTRLAQRIPISLLELNTFGHAICALFIYLLWWEKPFEVDYPTMTQGQILWDICALAWMHFNRSSACTSFNRDFKAYLEGDQWYQTLSKKQQQRLLLYPEKEIDLIDVFYFDNIKDSDPGQDNENHKINSEQETRHDRDNETSSTILAPDQTLQGTGFKARNFRDIVERFPSLDSYNGSHAPLPSIRLTNRDVTRWKIAWRAAQVYKWKFDWKFDWSREFANRMPIVQRCKDWPAMDNIFDEPLIILGFSAAALIYGGLHALAWFAHFDSSTEQLLWRISACVVMGGAPVIFVLEGFIEWLKYHDFLGVQVVINGVRIPVSLVILAYILARAYLVVGCFINLSHLPAEVYDVPTWSTYFPHIS